MLSFSLVEEALTGLIYHRPSDENSSFQFTSGGWGIEEVWGPLYWAPGLDWITESPRVVLKGLIGLGVATTTLALFSNLHPVCPTSYQIVNHTQLSFQVAYNVYGGYIKLLNQRVF